MNKEAFKKARTICNDAIHESKYMGLSPDFGFSALDGWPLALDDIERLEKEKINAENTIKQLRKENELLREKLSHLQKNVEYKGTIHGAMCDDFEGFVKTMADREKRGKRY